MTKFSELVPSVCNVDESGNFQKPLKITSLKQIYLQIEKTIYPVMGAFESDV